MNAEKVKKLTMQVMIGSLIVAALIAVVAVLAGSFNDTFGKALDTLFLVMLHSLTSLSFLGQTLHENRAFKFFENTIFALIIMSFFTSVLGVWSLLDGETVGKLYMTYAVLFFASLHGQMLWSTRGKEPKIDAIVTVNYVFMVAVILLLLPPIWVDNGDFPSVYYRILAALGIIDATLTILAVIQHRMYMQKHPELQSPIYNVPVAYDAKGKPLPAPAGQKRHFHPLIWLLGLFIVGQVVLPLIYLFFNAISQ